MGSQRLSRIGIALALMLLAGTLRFYKLGEWPFAGDETTTLAETRHLFCLSEASAASETQESRLPRLIPLSYVVHHLSITLFGRDEFGSRVLLAGLGTLFVGLLFVMLDGLQGRPAALATALLVALWPEHVYQSQETRFYIVAGFFAGLCLLIGAWVAKRPTVARGVALGGALLAAILCHTLLGVLLAIVVAGILAGAWAERRPLPRGLFFVFVGYLLVLGLFFLFYARPLLQGWNAGVTWGYSSAHALLASVNMVGWPITLLASVGFLLLWVERQAQNWYWNTCALGFAAATVTFPLLVAFHPEYVFPLALGVFVLAGTAVGTIYEGLRGRHWAVGVAWVAVACLGNMPSLVSHYRDGSRPDLRTAAHYVQQHWQEGDRLTGFSPGLLRYYAPKCGPAIPLSPSDTPNALAKLANGPGRLWVVVQSGRSGLSPDLFQWLGPHCSHETTVRRTRFDYGENVADVFLYTPGRRIADTSPLDGKTSP